MINLKIKYTILDLDYEMVLSCEFTSSREVFNIEDIKCKIIKQLLYNELKINRVINNSVNYRMIRKLLYKNMEIKCIIKTTNN